MANVFISYSRKDQQFVRDLHTALQQRDLDSWVDWEDIPLTADFLREIYSAIEAADTFVFVISPDSVRSEVCGREIAHAVEHGKRLIPVVRRPGAEKEMPPAVARLNWIFFRPEDEFDASLDALVTAIATDLDHVHTHTRLLIRALEWGNRGKNEGLLLRGAALREAEEWLAGVGDKNPQPTDLQREYVLTSRRAQTGRLRSLVAAAAAAVVLSLVLAVLALVQRGDALTQRGFAVTQQGIAEERRADAEEQRTEAEAQRGVAVAERATAEAARTVADTERGRAVAQESTAVAQTNARATAEARAVSERDAAQQARDEAVRQQRLAQSRELAASALVQLERDPELGVRLATEAMRIAPTREAEETLRRALGLALSRRTLRGHAGEVRGVAYSPDGASVFTGGTDGTARLWDIATGRERFAVRVPNGSEITRVAISPNGRLLATASTDGIVGLWDATTGANAGELRGHEKNVHAVTFSRDGRWFATAGADSTARIWEMAEPGGGGREVAVLRGHTGAVWDVAFSPDGKRVVTAGGDGTARIWGMADTERWQTVASLVGHSRLLRGSDAQFNRLDSARFSPDNARVVTASFDGTARVWEAATGKQVFELRMYGPDAISQVLHAEYSPGGKRIVTVGSDGAASVWDATTGGRSAELRGHESLAFDAVFSPDGLRIVTTSADRTARVWDATTGESIALLIGHTDAVTRARFSPDGTRVVTASADGTARIWAASAGQEATAVYHNVIGGAALSPDGTLLRTVDGLGIVETWDAATGATRGKTRWYDGKNIWFLTAFSPDGTRLVLANRLDSNNGDAVANLRSAPDVVIWDPVARRVVAEMRGHMTAVSAAVFSPDGTRLLTADGAGTVGVWDAATGNLLFAVAHGSDTKAAAFSADGRRFVTGGNAAVRVWDAANGTQIAEIIPADSANAVGLTRDGRRLVAGGSANSVRVWNVDTRAVLLELRGHMGFIRSAGFSPDGRQVLTSATDGTDRVWDATTGQSLLVLRDHLTGESKAGVRAAFDATGRRIVTYADDSTARVTPCDACGTPDDLLRTVAARGIRDFTTEERARYLPEVKP